MAALQEIGTVIALAPAKPTGLAELGVPLDPSSVVKKGRAHEFAQLLADGTIGRRFQDLRVTAIQTQEAAAPSAKVFVQFEVFGDNTAVLDDGSGFQARLFAGDALLADLTSSALFLPYGNFWYANRFVFDVPAIALAQADRFEFIATSEDVRAL